VKKGAKIEKKRPKNRKKFREQKEHKNHNFTPKRRHLAKKGEETRKKRRKPR